MNPILCGLFKVQIADRILKMQGRPPMLVDQNLGWPLDPVARITPGRNLPSFSHVRLGDRQQLQQVLVMHKSMACTQIFSGAQPSSTEKRPGPPHLTAFDGAFLVAQSQRVNCECKSCGAERGKGSWTHRTFGHIQLPCLSTSPRYHCIFPQVQISVAH